MSRSGSWGEGEEEDDAEVLLLPPTTELRALEHSPVLYRSTNFKATLALVALLMAVNTLEKPPEVRRGPMW